MDYVVFALLLVCCFKGWFKGLLYFALFLAGILLVLLLIFKNSNIGQELVAFLNGTKLSGMFYKNVLQKIIGLI